MKHCRNHVAGCTSLLVLVLCSLGYARAEECSARTLHGRYGAQFSGVSATLGLASSVFDFTADGQGAIPSGSATEIFRRSLPTINITFTGSYTVSKDCTGTLTIKDNTGATTTNNFVLSEDGRQIILADNTTVGNVLTGFGERQSADPDRVCSAASFRGQFSFAEIGVEDLAQFTIVGKFTADGKGSVSNGTATIAQAPVTILNEPPVLLNNQAFTGTFTVNSDCSGTLALVQGSTPLRSFAFVLVDNGAKALLTDVRDGDAIDILTAVASKLRSRDDD